MRKKNFETELRKLVAQQARIPVDQVRDETPIRDPEAIATALVMKLNTGIICRSLGEATTFGGAKKNIVVG